MSKNSGASVAITANTQNESNEIKLHKVISLSDHMLEKTVLPGNGQYLLTFLSGCSVLPMQDYKLYVTDKYSAFSRLAENRDINEQHVHALMESFVRDGYLFTIIYVNEKMEIIDGQHRFEGAKRKHLPINFIVMPGWGINEVSVLNVNSRNWTAEDFMNTHAKSGNHSYMLFKEFFDDNEFDITTAQLIILGRRINHVKGGGDDFRSGKMVIDEQKMASARIKTKKIKMLKDFHPYGWKSRNCVEAMLTLFNIKGYEHGHMIETLKKWPETMLFEAHSLRTEEYLKFFTDKYNRRKKEKISLD